MVIILNNQKSMQICIFRHHLQKHVKYPEALAPSSDENRHFCGTAVVRPSIKDPPILLRRSTPPFLSPGARDGAQAGGCGVRGGGLGVRVPSERGGRGLWAEGEEASLDRRRGGLRPPLVPACELPNGFIALNYCKMFSLIVCCLRLRLL